MASNLKSARQAIEAELAHARQGAAYYAARVDALETALRQLESVEGEAVTPARSATPQAKTRSRKANGVGNGASHGGEAKRGRKSRATNGSTHPNGGLSTRGDFWLNLVTAQPQSAVDIANAAIETLGIKSDQKEKIQKLKQRVSPALASLVSSHKIRDSGAGRARRFFRSEYAGSA